MDAGVEGRTRCVRRRLEVCAGVVAGKVPRMTPLLRLHGPLRAWLISADARRADSRRAARDRTTLLLVATGSIAALGLGAASVVGRRPSF